MPEPTGSASVPLSAAPPAGRWRRAFHGVADAEFLVGLPTATIAAQVDSALGTLTALAAARS